MTNELVISPIKDEKINSHINTSEIWKKAFKPEEITKEVRGKYAQLYAYYIRFEGLRPIMMTKIKAY